MRYAKIIAWISFIMMSVALVNGFVNGSFFEDGGALFDNPWGIVSIVDLYAGFFLFAIFIAVREEGWLRKSFLIVTLMILGFWLASLYVLVLLYTNDSLEAVLLGNKKARGHEVA